MIKSQLLKFSENLNEISQFISNYFTIYLYGLKIWGPKKELALIMAHDNLFVDVSFLANCWTFNNNSYLRIQIKQMIDRKSVV